VADIIQKKGKVCFTVEEVDLLFANKITKKNLIGLYRIKKKFVGRVIQ